MSSNKKTARHMKAIVYTKYGPPDVLQLKEVEKPTPRDNEVLIKVHAASVNAADGHTLRADPFFVRLMGNGLLKPKHKILGIDIAGRIEAVGRNVKQFQPGDEVFGISDFGAFAEHRCVTEDKLGLKPANISFEEAAAVPVAALTALQGLRDKGQIQPGQKVLINGASGGVGTFAVQIAKSFGTEVTGVCSTRNLDMVRSIGADQVIDYTQEDFTKSGQRYDLILAANGYHPIFDYRRALSPKGIYVMSGGSMAQFLQAALLGPWISMTGSKKMGFMGVTKPNKKDLVFLKELLEAGKVKPVIDRRYTLSEVAEALRYLEEGHARGKVVITLKHNNKISQIKRKSMKMFKSKKIKRDTKRLFLKIGACSSTFFYILNREFGYPMETEVRAADPLAGGLMQQGYQCGMLWGSALAVGAESFRRHDDRGQAIGIAITATQHLMESFSKRAKSVNCRDITGCDFSSKISMVKYFLFGRVISCFKLAEKWAPEAIQSATEGLSHEQTDLPQLPISCASEVAKKMGASDDEMVMVAGFAGGLGLSGNACGALSAAMWMNTLAWCRKHPGKSAYPNPNTTNTLKAFYEVTDSEILCHKICGQCFKTIDDHTEFIKNGGCDKLINVLAR